MRQVLEILMRASNHTARRKAKIAILCLILLFSAKVWTQAAAPETAANTAQSEAPVKDTLGRATPRVMVLGFLNATRKGNTELAALYLNTPLRGEAAAVLARQLGVVLDRRLPVHLNQISDLPEGSVPNPLRPDEDVIGKIDTADGQLDIIVEHVDRGKFGKVWLFSRQTLASIPSVFGELSSPLEEFLPEFMVTTRVAGIPVFEWLALFVGMPFLFLLTGALSRTLAWGVGALRRRLRHSADPMNPQLLPLPVRLLLIALVIWWLVARVPLPLLARQFWSTTALLIAISSGIWLLLLLSSWGEDWLVGRNKGLSGLVSVLRLSRRITDGLFVFAGFLFVLYHFGINLTAALAGLGVGGIAVALAAQKTLENVIGGVSLVADQALRVGDFLSLGDVQGTVEEVGLRSTRIRTLDRTLVSLPNGQIANMRLETFSVRDRFWFHPVIGLRYETTSVQLHSVLANLREFVSTHHNIDPASVRVRFIRFGAFSLDVEVFAYVSARDWSNFLEIQEELLFGIIEIVHKAGTEIAFPSQTLYVAADSSQKLTRLFAEAGNQTKARGVPDDLRVLSRSF